MKSTSVVILSLWLLAAPFVHAIWNPIISGWNPDAAILRHGKDYYITCSSFEYTPGLPIYHSESYMSRSSPLSTSAITVPRHGPIQLDSVQPCGDSTRTASAVWNRHCGRWVCMITLKIPGNSDLNSGAWAPSLARFKGKFWLAAMTRWTYDPVARVWPRVWFISSTDMVYWSDPVWAEPWGIDPELFNDPVTGKTYLNLMAPNNNQERLWGLSGCEVSLTSGKCIGPYVSLWNGTLPQGPNARPEGSKTVYKAGHYYLIAAEGMLLLFSSGSIWHSDDYQAVPTSFIVSRSREASMPWALMKPGPITLCSSTANGGSQI